MLCVAVIEARPPLVIATHREFSCQAQVAQTAQVATNLWLLSAESDGRGSGWRSGAAPGSVAGPGPGCHATRVIEASERLDVVFQIAAGAERLAHTVYSHRLPTSVTTASQRRARRSSKLGRASTASHVPTQPSTR